MPLPKCLATLLLRDYPVLPYLSVSYPCLRGRYKLVTHPFATDQKVTQKGKGEYLLGYSFLYRSVSPSSPFDLHVLGAPLAFILSYDQTLLNVACTVVMVALTLISLESETGGRGYRTCCTRPREGRVLVLRK